jgi:hypothetical protein
MVDMKDDKGQAAKSEINRAKVESDNANTEKTMAKEAISKSAYQKAQMTGGEAGLKLGGGGYVYRKLADNSIEIVYDPLGKATGLVIKPSTKRNKVAYDAILSQEYGMEPEAAPVEREVVEQVSAPEPKPAARIVNQAPAGRWNSGTPLPEIDMGEEVEDFLAEAQQLRDLKSRGLMTQAGRFVVPGTNSPSDGAADMLAEARQLRELKAKGLIK